MIRISATTIEQFRRVMTTEYATEEELIASVMRKPFEPSWQMQAGTALHELLADPLCLHGPASPEDWIGDTWLFRADHIDAAKRHIGPGLWEVKATRTIGLECRATIVAQADHVNGRAIQDNKAKFSTPDARDYEQSLQWRLYLWAHGADCFRYNLFDFGSPKGDRCELRDIIPVRFWRYAELERDCLSWIRAFVRWAEGRSLLPYLDRESSTMEAA